MSERSQWIAVGILLLIAGINVSFIGYVTLWGDFSGTGILPELSGIGPLIIVSIAVATTIGLVGYMGFGKSAVVGATAYALVLMTAVLDTFLTIPLPVQESGIIIVGLPVIGVITIGIVGLDQYRDRVFVEP